MVCKGKATHEDFPWNGAKILVEKFKAVIRTHP